MAVILLFAIAATLSGIFIIEYTEAFFLVVIFWAVVPVLAVQLVRRIRARIDRTE